MKLVKNYLIALAIFMLSFFVLLFIVSCIFANTKIEDRYLDAFSYGIVVIPSFISSFVLSKIIKNKGFIHGIVINAICMCILMLLYCILNRNIGITNSYVIFLGTSVLCGIIGGVCGVNV